MIATFSSSFNSPSIIVTLATNKNSLKNKKGSHASAHEKGLTPARFLLSVKFWQKAKIKIQNSKSDSGNIRQKIIV